MLGAGEQVPFFEVTDSRGGRVAYRDVWQRKNLLVVVGPHHEPGFRRTVVDGLEARMTELTSRDTAVVMTADAIEGLPNPGVLVADQWGEIFHVAPIELGGADVDSADATHAAHAADAETLIEWLRYIQMQCPECQGEAR